MADKIFGTDFTNETTPTSGMTTSVNNGSVLLDVELQYLYKAFGAAAVEALLALLSTTQGAIIYRGPAGWTVGLSGRFLQTQGAGSDPAWADGDADIQALLDNISTTQGTILYYNGTNWVALSPGTSGHFLQTLGAGANPAWASAVGNIQTLLDVISTTQGTVLYYNGTDWVALSPGTSGQFLKTFGASANPAWATLPSATGWPAGHIHGLTLSNNVADATNDIDITAGEARSSANDHDISLASGLTKRLDAAWAVGTNQGGLDTGAIANATYHVWLIKRSDTSVVDVLFSLSATAPTMPTNYDYKRRIGSIVRTGGAIKAFYQTGDKFMWTVPVYDLSSGTATSATAVTLTIPAGIKVEAILGVGLSAAGAGSNASVFDPDVASSVSANIYATFTAYIESIYRVFTNTSGQVKYFKSVAATNVFIQTHGWVDTRGRLS
jgi:hypothetical protein